jgi:penicillin V acylase-like amidase (Ntn superfamily)
LEKEPDRPNISPTIFRTVMDLTGNRYFFESTYAPNVVWIDTSKIDFTKGLEEQELKVEKKIMKLHGDVTSQFEKVKPMVFGVNKQ